MDSQIIRPASLAEVLADVMDWLARGECKIQDRDTPGRIISLSLDTLTPPQWSVLNALADQAGAGEPGRISVPKFRRGGISSLWQAISYRICRRWPLQFALTVSHTKHDTIKLFRTALRIRNHDGRPGTASAQAITFDYHGSGVESIYECMTGGGKGPGRGSGYTVLHISELPQLQSTQGLDAEATAAMLNMVPDSPDTLICLEATGQGPTGEFHRITMDAAAGRGRFKLVFLAWKDDPRNAIDPPATFTPTAAESALAKAHALSPAQTYWRHLKRADHPDDASMRREYPLVLADCFTVAMGLVYGSFNAVPIAQRGHVGRLPIGKDWKRYRAIDWGSTEAQPFVCLWLAHSKSHPPRLIIDPDCRGDSRRPGLIEEFSLYARHPKTGAPIDAFNHGTDALRYACVRFNLTGLVYVYREMRVHNGGVIGLTGCVKEIYRAEGIEVPETEKAVNLADYARKINVKYAGTVADRSQPLMMRDCSNWGIRPIIGQPTMVPRFGTNPTPDTTDEKDGEVEGGIAWVQALLTGDALFFEPSVSTISKVYKKLDAKATDNRDTDPDLSKREQRILRQLERERTSGKTIEI